MKKEENNMKKELLDYWLAIPYDLKRTIMFNTFSKEQIVVNDSSLCFDDTKNVFELGEILNNSQSSIPNYLQMKNKEVDLDQWIKQMKNSKELNLTLILGYDCNMKCSYCYEQRNQHKQKLNTFMSESNYLDNLIKYIDTYIDTYDIKVINIEFYGGEPFLYYVNMLYLAQEISLIAKKKCIALGIGIMTNGILIDKVKIENLISVGLYKLEISVDGGKETHNNRRPMKNNEDSYETIMSNIIKLCDLVPITIRVNVDNDNVDKIAPLLDDLLINRLNDKVKIYFTPVIECTNKCEQISDVDLFSNIGKLYEVAGSKKIAIALNYYAIGPCHIHKQNSYGITPNGEMYKCFPVLESKVGVLADDIDFDSYSLSVDNWNIDASCLNCSYLPICYGGCVYEQKGKSSDKKCPINVFQNILPGVLKSKAQYFESNYDCK